MGSQPTSTLQNATVKGALGNTTDPVKPLVDAVKGFMKAWEAGAEQLLDSLSVPENGTPDEDYKAWKTNSKKVMKAWTDSFYELGKAGQPAAKPDPLAGKGPGQQKIDLNTPVLAVGETDNTLHNVYFPPWLEYPVTLWVNPSTLCTIAPPTITTSGMADVTFTFEGPAAAKGTTQKGTYGCSEASTAQNQQRLTLGEIELVVL